MYKLIPVHVVSESRLRGCCLWCGLARHEYKHHIDAKLARSSAGWRQESRTWPIPLVSAKS
ncbi:uncharacterized protein METZ01_LOCUS72416 [marine metagenome]|uniref:Uncharacterized protein n=1 Tax=marine metagenome TaxID=408172 RepID=A0A381TU41_9ZZZZ